MSGFGYNVLGFGANASSAAAGGASDDEFNRVSFLSHFDGANNGVNNAFDDSSTSNHTIAANGNATQGSFGPFARPDGEWGVSFDGDGDYLTINEGATGGSGNWTIEMFINPSDVSSGEFGTLLDNRPDSTNGLYQTLVLDAATLKFYVGGTGASYRITSDDALTANTWFHVALCKSGSSTKLFIDGTQTGSTFTDNVTYADNNRTLIGAEVTFGSGIDEFFNGQISNFRTVNSALYTGNFTAPTSKLTAVSNTAILTCQSNRFVDNSGNAHTVTPSGNAAVTAFGPFLTSAVYDAAVNGASAYFDGDNDSLSTGDSADFVLGDTFTLEAWVYPTAADVNSYPQIMSQAEGYPTGWYFSLRSTNEVNFYLNAADNAGGAIDLNTDGSDPVQLNAWNHVALSVSSGTGYIYVNGARKSSAATGINNNLDRSGTTFRVGVHNAAGAYDFDGYICDARVVKGTAVYSGTTYTIPTAPLTAITNTKLLLNMADGQAIDSAAQNNLTLYGTAKTSTAQKKFGDTSIYLSGGGDDDYVMFDTLNGPLEGLSTTSPATIEGYFNWDGTQRSGGFRTVIGINRLSDGNNTLVLYCGNSSGQGILGLRYSGGSEQVLDSSIATNTWHHFAMVLNNGSYKFQFFLNGTSVFTSTSTINVAPNDCSFVIGAEADGANAGSLGDAFTGYIDEIRVSHMARYTSNFTAPTEPFADKGQ